MAQLLRKSRGKYTIKGGSTKYRVSCSALITDDAPTTDDWLFIKKHLSKDHPVLHGILNRHREVIVKFGLVPMMQKEFALSEKIKDIPNIIGFHCFFTCNDTVNNIGRVERYPSEPFICKGPGDGVGVLVMPYYNIGSILHHRWNTGNVALLKNLLKQICAAVLFSNQQHGFIHKDAHLDNVLIKRTKKSVLQFGEMSLDIHGGYLAVLMDFEKSEIEPGNSSGAYKDIRWILSQVSSLDNNDIEFVPPLNKINVLTSWSNHNKPITNEIYNEIWSIIDSIQTQTPIRRPTIDFASANWNKPI